MFNALIIEDEKNVKELMENFLTNHIDEVTSFLSADNVDDGLKIIQSQKIDLVFLDIMLGNKTGFDFLELMQNPNIPVIFVTAHTEFALQVIKTNQVFVDFITKPISITKLKSAIKNIKEKLSLVKHSKPSSSILVNVNREKKLIRLNHIIYLTGIGKKSCVHLQSGEEIEVSINLGELEKKIDHKNFIRISKNSIVNIQFIESINTINKEVLLQHDIILKLTKVYQKNVLARLT